ncbi:Hsp70 family protein [Tropicibacter sp. R16_0]|uniref:Hsp70 family protein n=1 Tax=Tropicibacter sp. R16_0 TaxID=2821102 RepID=UPI001ADA0295|nr:Hsp70 family protein [Tropicibacter sp. R16_0]MBO9451898.1 Hsp70 family protein [Tropicibacter sp. R16_0]
MAQNSPVLGIDFGTSNSAAGILRDGKPHLIEIEPGQQTLPTTFFFDFDTRKTLIGSPANAALIDGLEGRFMRALKRVLGTSLMHEKRQILNERVTFVDIIARFLSRIKAKAEVQTGLTFDAALSGRPVNFHGPGDTREAQAEDDLRQCYLAAGFKQVDFMAEPEAAAIASGATRGRGLIVDIGGGTSDFSLFETDAQGHVTILANHGIRIGGTDFDRVINVDTVMPLLGKGTQLRKDIGAGLLTAPNAIFNDLATWEKIPFLYTAQTRRMASDMAKLAEEPAKLHRLVTVLEDELGHDLAFAVERGKIDANKLDVAQAHISLDMIEHGLAAPLDGLDISRSLAAFSTALYTGARDTLQMADCAPGDVSHVIYVGGSSLMSLVPQAMQALLPGAKHSFTEVFTAVADGLAIAANRP